MQWQQTQQTSVNTCICSCLAAVEFFSCHIRLPDFDSRPWDFIWPSHTVFCLSVFLCIVPHIRYIRLIILLLYRRETFNMRLTTVLTGALATIASAHADDQAPKLVDARRFLSEMKVRNAIPGLEAAPASLKEDKLHVRQTSDGRCGAGLGSCTNCCSAAGYNLPSLIMTKPSWHSS